MDYKTSLKLLQYPAKLYNDIDETFIRTLGFDLPKFKMSNREQVWDFGEEPVAAAVATPEPVVTAVITLPETQEILQNKELKVHPVFGVVMKFTPFTPSGTPKEKKEQTKNEIKTSKPKLQKLMDDLNDLESQFERAGTIVDNLNKRYFEIKADYDRNKDKGLKAEMYRLKEELKPYEIQFDALEQKFQALNILKSTEEFKYETLKTLYETFKEKEGKGIFKIKEGGALKGLDPTKKTEILKYSDPKKAIKNAIQYLKNNIVFSLSTKKTKKYMVQRPDGKWIHFGEMGYEDFTKHQDEKRRDNYLKRTANMKGNWKDDKYSANNLARNILW
jgi:chromosome segregation ATPase